MKQQLANLTAALLILGASSSAYAQNLKPVLGRASKCVQMPISKAIIAAQMAPVPRVLEGGNEILPLTASTAILQATTQPNHVTDILHNIRMRFRLSDVKPAETNKFIDFTTLCHGWTEKNGDYLEECSLHPTPPPNTLKVGILDYQTRTQLRDGKVDGCKPGVMVSIEYGVVIDPAFMKLVGGMWLMALTDDEVNARLKGSIDGLFNNWVSGFKP